MSYCAIEEAFAPLVPGGTSSKKQKKMRSVIVPSAPAGSDAETIMTSMVEPTAKAPVDPDRPTERPQPTNDILASPGQGSRLEAAGSSDFFPMQSDSGEPEGWQKAFLLNDIQVPKPTFSVQGAPTLWRSIQKPVGAAGDSFSSAASSSSSSVIVSPLGHGPSELAPIPDEISRRLDSLTRQLDSLVTPTPMQGTAELFLFVAIGLLLLLAIDTLLRYATASATATATATASGLRSSTGLQVLAGGGRRLARYR